MELYSLLPENAKVVGFYLLLEKRRRSLYFQPSKVPRTFEASLNLIFIEYKKGERT
ncbi:hypothetical protein F6O75_03345 [Streptococcus suis]|uniref:Uncharacterized protein n=3 Tax=Streptococcus suis TaxID=1307 RepID=A0A0H3N1L7_STRS4|nr:hypothetical protein SSU05_0114 [Streptococcus suis 05ZYH33]ABP91277.1 hypothetical protein SSU98_0117 [Streptococcus suis 98HAH33]ADE30575.1 hypothetical protein SSGZ1_0110 [Streptococcus suis GZ1]ADV69225.1 hypothetical protein SSUJS14_0116 [Streptococcus suis JS14]AER14315.1 hypothetical protein SSU12_0116 [Streptococcus suis SS12]AER43450.1 hypothetical protein SSUA7_0113 [Streptococcus suis A7]ARL69136.1 hypothetical protein B9H01_00755 [Streptococcus suis]CAR44336.1 hypothetical pro